MLLDSNHEGSFHVFSDGEIEVNRNALNLEDISNVSDIDSECVTDSISSESDGDNEFGFAGRLRNIELYDFDEQTR